MKRSLLVFLAASTLFGCVKPDPDPRFVPALEPVNFERPHWYHSRKILLVSDCQFHNLLSEAMPERNLSSEALAETAIRPPQLDMFSRDVLEFILADAEKSQAKAILHLGDALDIACDGEFRLLIETMSKTSLPWLMAPGNHDFFYLGVFNPQHAEVWKRACNASGQTMVKSRFIRLYVAAMLRQRDEGITALAESLGLLDRRDEDPFELFEEIPAKYEWDAGPDNRGFLQGIAWSIDWENPWRSFILQRANFGGLQETDSNLDCHTIIMDSCQYYLPPAVLPNAWDSYPLELNCGFTGELLGDQLRMIRKWVSEEADPNRFFMLACHHPLKEIAGKSLSSLRWLWRTYPRIGGALTAHTHEGHYEHHFLGESPDGSLVEGIELNLGSSTDWPMEWRNLKIHIYQEEIDDPSTRRSYMQSERTTLVEALKGKEGYFPLEWEMLPGERGDYRQYKTGEASGGTFAEFYLAYHLAPPIFGQPVVYPSQSAIDTEAKVKQTMLWTYDRLLRFFPTDTKRGPVPWPSGCTNDGDVRSRIAVEASVAADFDEVVELLIELDRFERERLSIDPKTGEPSDEARIRYKLCQAVWASRYEGMGGRTLAVEDELIRIYSPKKNRIKDFSENAR